MPIGPDPAERLYKRSLTVVDVPHGTDVDLGLTLLFSLYFEGFQSYLASALAPSGSTMRKLT